jgi:hypothetical protein
LRKTIEQFEERWMPASIYLVTDFGDTNTSGTLRFAINQANASNTGTAADPDQIQFTTGSGTINILDDTPLPALTSIAVLDATTAAGYAGTPIITLNGTLAGSGASGLTINSGSSTVKGFFIVSFSSNGILLNSSDNTIVGNNIGIDDSGTLDRGNGGDGVSIANGANNNLIGRNDPVTAVNYFDPGQVALQPVTALQGIRESDTPGQYLLVGSSNDTGLMFDGTIVGVGTSYEVNYPGAAATSVYGPDNLDDAVVRLVGTYKNADAKTAPVKVNGFLFEGTVADLSNSSNYRTINIPGAEFNYVHSTMGGLAVGNYDSAIDHGTFNLPLGPGHAFLYDVASDTVLTDIVFPGSLSNTAYGIWYNQGTSYTICGGWSPDAVNNFADQNVAIGDGYLVDYNAATGEFSN